MLYYKQTFDKIKLSGWLYMNEIIVESDIQIENMIYEVRGKQVMLDSDVAKLFGYETKYLNRQVQRNINRFPEKYCFKLKVEEYEILRCQNVTLNNKRGEHKKYMPYVFTEYGVTMLAGILKSEIAVVASLKIVDAFIKMRHYISSNLMEKSYLTEQVLENTRNIKLLQESFNKFNENKVVNEIYFEGQIYDAYSKILDILKEAKKEVIIIDSYSDKNTLDIIKNVEVPITIITSSKSKLNDVDIKKYNSQYNNLKVIYSNVFHDRYFILDSHIVYHCGTSLNYIGKKTFCINRIEDDIVKSALLDKISNLE